MKSALIIPTLNAKAHLAKLLPALATLSPKPDTILFIDSSSTDGTEDIIKNAGYQLHIISRKDFGRGTTRNLGAQLCADHDILIYLTQDAIPASTDCIAQLLAPFANEKVAVVCGRQLPHEGATIAARYARAYNYPSQNHHNDYADIATRGLRALFCSNSFAAYRASALKAVGGFPEALPMGEDMAVVGRLLEAGYTNFYAAQACAYHSHNYTLQEEFKRYFDIGTLLTIDPWLRARKLKSSGAGLRYVIGEYRHTITHGTRRDVASIAPRVAAKFIGFHLGKNHDYIPSKLKQKLSMHSYFWRGQS